MTEGQPKQTYKAPCNFYWGGGGGGGGGITRLLLEIVHNGWDPVNWFNTLVGWLSLSQLTVLSQTAIVV